MIDDELLAAYGRLDTGTVSDALDKLGISGVLGGIGRLTTTGTVVGVASTVQLAPEDGTPTTRHLCAAAIAESGPQSVIVVAGGRPDCGGWGGLLSRSAQQRGIRAAIVDGMSRDVDEAVALDFPIFARGSSPTTARGRQREVDSGVPVRIGQIEVSPGDLVVADGTGVVIVPAGRAAEVLAAAEEIDQLEQELIVRIEAQEQVTSVLGRNYESMLDERKIDE